MSLANLAVFVEDPKPMGGNLMSLEVVCGVVGVEPGPLMLPGLQMQTGKTEIAGGKG